MKQGVLLILLSLAAGTMHAQRKSVQSVVLTTKPELFVDDVLIARMENVTRTLHYPVRVAENPIIQPDRPWEGELSLQPGTVIFDKEERIFKMWYNSLATNEKPDIQGFICYAVSKDGVHWTKPDLNIVEFHGSKANNIVLKWCDWNLSVIKDMHETDKDKRYKLAYWSARKEHDPRTHGVWVAFSADGIHWTVYDHNPVVPVTASSDTFCVMQDPASHQFWMYHKSPIMPVRKVSRLVSDDFVHWKGDKLVLEPDDYDQPDTEYYGLSPFSSGSQYLGFLWVFHTYAQQMDLQLVSSRNGLLWQHTAHRRVFFPLGFMKNKYDGHAFDSEMIDAAAPPVQRDGELWIYYTGYHTKHNGLEGSAVPEGTIDTYIGRLGLAKLREDGFVSLDATSEGFVITRPLTFKGSTLSVNAEVYRLAKDSQSNEDWRYLISGAPDGAGSIRVEVEDEGGRPIPGYELSRSKRLTGNQVNQAVTWQGGKTLSGLEGRNVRFKFVLINARLYSFTIQ